MVFTIPRTAFITLMIYTLQATGSQESIVDGGSGSAVTQEIDSFVSSGKQFSEPEAPRKENSLPRSSSRLQPKKKKKNGDLRGFFKSSRLTRPGSQEQPPSQPQGADVRRRISGSVSRSASNVLDTAPLWLLFCALLATWLDLTCVSCIAERYGADSNATSAFPAEFPTTVPSLQRHVHARRPGRPQAHRERSGPAFLPCALLFVYCCRKPVTSGCLVVERRPVQ